MTRRSEALKGRKHPKGCNHCLSIYGDKNPFFGKKHTDEFLDKMRHRKFSQETRIKMSLAKVEYKPWNHGKKMSQEYGRKISIARKEKFANDSEFYERNREHLRRLRIIRPTKIEIILLRFLQQAYSDYEIIPEYKIDIYSIDCAIPDLKLAFEADGIYWHSSDKAKECDEKRDFFLQSLGWCTIRFDQKELEEIGLQI